MGFSYRASPPALLSALPAVKVRARWPRQRGVEFDSPIVLAKADDSRWQNPPHIVALNDALLSLSAREISRLAVEMPPRHGKSFMCSKYFPAWYLSQHPQHNVILASYEANFATLWGRRVRDVVDRFGAQLNLNLRPDTKAAGAWETQQGGGMFCAGVGGPMTGRGADVLIIDDPVKNAQEAESMLMMERTWEWYQSVAYTRLEPGAIVIIIMTRWNQLDLLGRVLKQDSDDDEQEAWKLLCFPALAEGKDELGRSEGEPLWPGRYPTSKLERIRARIGPYFWAALYQQRPAPREGGLWKTLWIEDGRVSSAEIPNLQRIVVAIDPAGSTRKHSDSTGITVAGLGDDGQIYVLASRGYVTSPDAWAQAAINLYHGWHADRIIAEKNYGGDMVESVLRHANGFVPFSLVSASRGKVLRAEPVAALYEQGRAHHLGSLPNLEDQMCSFPIANAHDDLVDSLVYAITDLMQGGEIDDEGFS